MVVLFLGAMIGLVYSQNLIYIYLFWEISAICCWRLIGFYREPEYIIRADKAFLVTVGGALAMLMGFVILYNTYGSFEIQGLAGQTRPQLGGTADNDRNLLQIGYSAFSYLVTGCRCGAFTGNSVTSCGCLG